MTTYGQRGGDGPNTGKKASVYQGTLPDGTVVKKRAFNFHGDSAFLYVFKFEGKWMFTGVFPDKSLLTENTDSYYIVAKKIS